MFSWAKYRRTKGGIKLHYGYDYDTDIPIFMTVTEGKVSDLSVAKSEFKIISDSIYCFDRGYISLEWFNRIDEQGAYFVTRAKNNMNLEVVGQHK